MQVETLERIAHASCGRDGGNVAGLSQTTFRARPYVFHELWLFVLVALCCGALAGGFLVLHDGVVARRGAALFSNTLDVDVHATAIYGLDTH